jgi:hypothetical protein
LDGHAATLARLQPQSNSTPSDLDRLFSAEEKGFEPLVPFGTAVFKTAAFDHSATPPSTCPDVEIFTMGQPASTTVCLCSSEKRASGAIPDVNRPSSIRRSVRQRGRWRRAAAKGIAPDSRAGRLRPPALSSRRGTTVVRDANLPPVDAAFAGRPRLRELRASHELIPFQCYTRLHARGERRSRSATR